MFILYNIINNVLSNFIPHETITCDDRNPPCFNKKIENLIKEKNTLFKKKKKQSLKYYRPISLSPIFSKMFKRIIYFNMFEYFTANYRFYFRHFMHQHKNKHEKNQPFETEKMSPFFFEIEKI